MKKKILVSLILILVIAIGLGFFVGLNEKDEMPKEISYPTFSVRASKGSEDLVDLDTSFELQADDETTLELVESSFSIVPSVEYEITAIKKDYYSLTLKEDLAPNTIYNIEYKTDKAPYKWSFQTQKVFDVANFYPAETKNYYTNYVLPSTVIEIDFTYMPNENIAEYFSITPKVEGQFLLDGRRVRFTPSKKLDLATTYTVNIKAGYGNKENDKMLLKDKEYKFYTAVSEKLGDMNGISYISFVDDKYAYGENKNIYLKVDNYDVREIPNFNLKVYQYHSGSDFAEDFIAKESYGTRKNLKMVDLNRLALVAEEEIKQDELIAYGWKSAIPVKSKLSAGYYVVVVNVSNIDYYLPLQINNIAAVSEYFDNNLLVWVNDLETGMPLPNAKVKIDGKVFGTTNAEGYCFVENVSIEENKELLEEISYDGKNTLYDAFVSTSYYRNNDSEYINAYIRIDRQAFKPGEKLQAWGFVKDRKNREFKEATLRILSLYNNDTILQEEKITLDEFGTFTSEFDLTNYISGYYEIALYLNGRFQAYHSFEVKDYDSSSYDIKLELDKQNVKAGEEINASLSANLFDGSPLANRTFVYSVEINGQKTQKNITTDENGKASFQIDTNMDYPYRGFTWGSVRVRQVGIEDQNYTYNEFYIYPNDESFFITETYSKEDNSFRFEVKTFEYDFSDMSHIKEGNLTDRNIELVIQKYHYEKEIISSYFDENTKTTEYVYRTNDVFDGEERFDLNTENGKASIPFENPYESSEEGRLAYNAVLTMANGKTITSRWNWYTSIYEENTSDILMPNYDIKYDENQNKYKTNDDIPLALEVANGTLNGTPYILYLVKSAKGTEVITTNDIDYKLKFKSEYGANITVKGFVFDGIAIREIGDSWYNTERRYSLSSDELKMDTLVEFDKEEYKPGEKAIITVTTKIDGKPVEASVNLCAVNKEYLAVNDEETESILSALYNYYYFNDSFKSFTHTVIGASYEGGGGGGDGEIRSDFATTAFFETIHTNKDGVATLEVTLPDNVTTWKVSVNATTKEYKATEVDKELKVTLPFFVTAVMNDKYLSGEIPSINLRCNGSETSIGDEVEYTVTIADRSGKANKVTEKSRIGNYVSISLGKLEKGTYTITINAASKGKSDAIRKEIEVVDTFQETMHESTYDLEKGQKLDIDKGWATLYLYNKEIENIVNDLFDLANMQEIRNDQKVISYLANNIIRKLSNEKEIKQALDISTYNGISLTYRGSPDTLFTAKMASTGYFNTANNENLLKYLYKITEDTDIDLRMKLYAYWGLAALKEPVLVDIKNIEKDLDVNDRYEKAIVALAYADIGDFEEADRLFRELKAGMDSDSDEVCEYMTMLAFKLNREEREELYRHYKTLNRETEYSNFVKLFRVQNEILNNVKDAKIVFEVDGEEKEFNINGVRIVPFSFTFANNVTVKNFTDNVRAKFLRNEAIMPNSKERTNIISKSYIVPGKNLEDIRVGDTVTVRIELDYSKLEYNGFYSAYVVEDVLPNGMRYMEDPRYVFNVVDIPYRKDGQKMYFYVHRYQDEEQYIEYEAIVTSSGEYVSDGVILKDMDNRIRDYLKLENLVIN